MTDHDTSTTNRRRLPRALALLLLALLPSVLLLLVVSLPLLPCPPRLMPVADEGIFFLDFVLPLIVLVYFIYGAAVGIGAFWRTREERPRRAALSLALLGGFALFVLSLYPAESLRWRLLRRIPVRARPLIIALEQFRKDNGRYPATLARLTPRYLKRLPDTGTLASPQFEYTRADASDSYGRGDLLAELHAGYDLSVYCPAYLLSSDAMHYWPSQHYPERIPAGHVVERVDGWAYVHHD